MEMKEPATTMWLPPGFRFHPTDEELITYYLVRKIADGNFNDDAITEVDLNTHEPWELPGKAQMMGNREWYFFSMKDKKYPMGCRTNRATQAGYWKATGKDKEVVLKHTRSIHLDHKKHVQGPIGMKKTLVFYEGRAPKGLKSNWEETWVLCRVFYKKKLQQLMRRVQQYSSQPPPASSKSIYSFAGDCHVSDDTNLLQTSTDKKHANDNIINANLPILPINDLDVVMPPHLPITPANISQPTNLPCCDSQHFNSMLNDELDTMLKSIPYTTLPRFPSELENMWLQTSSFLE